MAKALSSIKEFAAIAFLLLGVLFGMIIMTFIFGQLGVTNTNLADATGTTTNETEAWINTTTYTIAAASNDNFTGNFAVTQALNDSDGTVILSGNYTVDATAGTVVNATATTWENVSLTYTYTYKTNVEVLGEEVQNNSLQGIISYTNQASTQFTTVAIAITLIVLIAVFLLFWMIFIRGKGRGKTGGNFA